MPHTRHAPHRAHLFSLRVCHALREACLREPYTRTRLLRDLLAGATVGVIAIPLAMALAIASGVAPQYGLYSALVAGFVIALAGGSRLSVSGPTAAFVVILYPITHRYGLGGLLTATLMSGVILVLLAYLRLGRFIEYIPESVTIGFTSGIGVVIATLQIKDALGLDIARMPSHFVEIVAALAAAMDSLHWSSLLVAALTLAIMLLWPRLKLPVPAHLPAVIAGSLLAVALNQAGAGVDTIGSRFAYTLADGSIGHGIPSALPGFALPWSRSGADGAAAGITLQLLIDLLPAAFAIAMLGAIESLLCAVVLDGMTGRRHSANSELLGQGIGNIVAPFFGGITATAAIARSTANFRAGATSPVAAMTHALVILLGLVSLAPLLAYLPMPAIAALLLVVAWNMSEAPKALHLLKTAPRGDVWVLLTCFGLTVIFDMVIAITAGILLAALLFMKEIAELTRVSDISADPQLGAAGLPPGWSAHKVSGPLFFAPADRIFGELAQLSASSRGIIVCLEGVPLLDAGGVAAMNKLVSKFRKDGAQVWFTDLQFQPLKTLARAGITPLEGTSRFFPTLAHALDEALAPHNAA